MLQLDETKRKVRDLEGELRQANDHIQFLTQINLERSNQVEYLENKIRRLNKQLED